MNNDLFGIEQFEAECAEVYAPDPVEEKVKQSTFVTVRLKDKTSVLELSGMLVSISNVNFALKVVLRIDVASALEVMNLSPTLLNAVVATNDFAFQFQFDGTITNQLTTYNISNIKDGTCDFTIGK